MYEESSILERMFTAAAKAPDTTKRTNLELTIWFTLLYQLMNFLSEAREARPWLRPIALSIPMLGIDLSLLSDYQELLAQQRPYKW